jgi:predicted neuraminidase
MSAPRPAPVASAFRRPRSGRPWALVSGAALALGLAWAIEAHRGPAVPGLGEPRFAAAASDAAAAPRAFPRLTASGVHRIPVDPGKPASHASSIAALPAAGGEAGGSGLLAYWFAGSRESGPDVEIVASRFDPRQAAWSASHVVVNRHDLALRLGFNVRRLGNPVAWIDAQGRVHLFVVGTGLGGWAASRIVHLLSDDGGRSFAPLRVLPLSPLFNLSTLVRAPAEPLDDGGAVLPVHFEIGRKYPMALRLSPLGVPVGLARMSHGPRSLQPSIVALDPDRAIALLRDSGPERRLRRVSTDDGGRSWSDEGPTNQANPDASVVVVRLADGTLVAALNPAREGRRSLVLALSRTGTDWQVVQDVESGTGDDEFSYPSLVVADDRLHLSYTHQRRFIVHRTFEIGSERR